MVNKANEAAVPAAAKMFPNDDALSEALRAVFIEGFERGYRASAFESLREIELELDLA